MGPAFSLLVLRKARAPCELHFGLGPAFSLLVLRKARAPCELHFGLGPAFALQLQQGLAVLQRTGSLARTC
jgi:hypothetical protein